MTKIHSNKSSDRKQSYEKPTVTRIGTLESITQAAHTGHAFDSNIIGITPGTPVGNMFSD
jgi:hypothetical protein